MLEFKTPLQTPYRPRLSPPIPHMLHRMGLASCSAEPLVLLSRMRAWDPQEHLPYPLSPAIADKVVGAVLDTKCALRCAPSFERGKTRAPARARVYPSGCPPLVCHPLSHARAPHMSSQRRRHHLADGVDRVHPARGEGEWREGDAAPHAGARQAARVDAQALSGESGDQVGSSPSRVRRGYLLRLCGATGVDYLHGTPFSLAAPPSCNGARRTWAGKRPPSFHKGNYGTCIYNISEGYRI